MNKKIKQESELLIVVDDFDRPIKKMDKTLVHKTGVLHRAVSVILVNSNNEVLVQQRAITKYHSPGKWANTCCTHPYWGESNENACKRRLIEEMGIECDKWYYWRKLKYFEDVGNGMVENEIDHLYFAFTDNLPNINKYEVMNYKYIPINELQNEIENNKNNYTYWSTLVLKEVNLQLINKIKKLYE
jgi:isopentenyl-diphosphate delta-isomerase